MEEQTAHKATGLVFRRLPAYARFLLDQRLEDFTAHQASLVRELNVPLLKYFAAMSDEQFFQLALASAREFLTALADNKAKEFIDTSVKNFQSNSMKAITRDQVSVDDITLICHARKEGILEFLDAYTPDASVWKTIVSEISLYTLELESRTINSLLATQQDLYNQSQRLSGIGNFVWDLARNTFTWSDQLYRIYEFEPGTELTMDALRAATHPDDVEKAALYMRDLIANRGLYDYHYRIVMKDGRQKVLHARGTIQVDEIGNPVALLGTLQDVSAARKHDEERRRFTEHLRESEQRLQTILENAPDAVIVMDIDGLVEKWNAKAEQTFGWAESEVLGKPLHRFIIPERFREAHVNGLQGFRATQTGPVINNTIEIKGLRRDGIEIDVNLSISATRSGERQLFTGFVRDVTERTLAARRLEETVRELERSNKELAAFSVAASHDLREPLRKIQLFSDRILDRDGSAMSAASSELFLRIGAAAARMQNLIEDLLTYSQLGSATKGFAPVDLNALVNDIAQASRSADDHITIQVNPLPTVNANELQMRQLFDNLINNAIKYRKPDSPLTITVSATETDNGSGPNHRSNRAHAISVTDNGIGFEQQYAHRIFEMFQRLHAKEKYEGTGIGLAICKKIVENHGGRIEATSALGEGSAFTVLLPAE